MFFKLIASFLLVLQPGTVLVDRIAAVVNKEIITVSDIDKSLFFNSPMRITGENDDDLYLNELNNLINYKVVFLEYRDQFQISDEDYENVQRLIIKRYGSLIDLISILKKFDMDMKDLRSFLLEKILYEKVIEDKHKLGIAVEFMEIENFYKKEYLPSQKNLNIEVRSIIEMTPVIENHLRGKKVRKELSQWLKSLKTSYSIRNILAEEKK